MTLFRIIILNKKLEFPGIYGLFSIVGVVLIVCVGSNLEKKLSVSRNSE